MRTPPNALRVPCTMCCRPVSRRATLSVRRGNSHTQNRTDERANELFNSESYKKITTDRNGEHNIIRRSDVQKLSVVCRRNDIAMWLCAITQYPPFVSKYNGIQCCILGERVIGAFPSPPRDYFFTVQWKMWLHIKFHYHNYSLILRSNPEYGIRFCKFNRNRFLHKCHVLYNYHNIINKKKKIVYGYIQQSIFCVNSLIILSLKFIVDSVVWIQYSID